MTSGVRDQALTSPVQAEIAWDGKVHSHRPAPDWQQNVSPDLRLHTEADDQLDPVTFEEWRRAHPRL
jgi:hypothetical protein